MRHIRLDWKSIHSIAKSTSPDDLMVKYADLFKDELGKVNQFQATLHIKPDAHPRFFKPRSVPFAIKAAIDKELDELESSGIISKVTHSDWAAPIVPVPKKNGRFRICGDYKVTINQALEVDQYPLPKPEDLFATLAGGKKFSKLDLSQAYQQLVLDDESQKFRTVNTHRGNKHAPPPAPLHPWTWPAKPWQRIHIDFAGPFLGKSFLVIVDAHSKWPEIFDMPTTSATQTIATLRQLFASYGLPEQIVSDNGPQFTSEEFADFMKKNGIKHTRCAPYHPASNGAVERFFKQAMKASEHDGRSLAHRLANFLLSYRATPHSTTNQSPSSLFLNRTLRTRLSLVHPDTEQHVFRKQTEQESQHNLHAKERHFTTGQEVMVRNLRPGSKWVSGCITRQLGPVTYLIATKAGQIWKRHIDHIRDNSFVPTPADIELQEHTETDSDNFLPSLPIETSITEDTLKETTTPRYSSRPRIPPERYM